MINYYYWLCALEGIKQRKRDCNHEKIQNCWAKTKALKNFVEENSCDDKEKKTIKKASYQLEKIEIICKILTNPYKRVLKKTK